MRMKAFMLLLTTCFHNNNNHHHQIWYNVCKFVYSTFYEYEYEFEQNII